MSRNPDYQFVPTDTSDLIEEMVVSYERITGVTLSPASPERLFLQWVANIILQERVLSNYIGNQNLPSRASGEDLDALGDLYFATSRPDPTAATCKMRFYISEPQESAILIPAGTRVTDRIAALIWETETDAYVEIGASYADVTVRCQTIGAGGNNWLPGQINTIVDVFDYYASCENISTSDGGADAPDDAEYYELLRASLDSFSTAGAIGSYTYHAKRVSSEIADVIANSPVPGEVRLYVLMADGSVATDVLKQEVLDACNEDTVRPLTDHVQVEDPEVKSYEIDLTYWITAGTTGAAEIEEKVSAAVQEYITWQSSKLGLDINPSVLHGLLMQTGIKRVEIRNPRFTVLRGGRLTLGVQYPYEETIPQVASVGTVSVVNGGYEDE